MPTLSLSLSPLLTFAAPFKGRGSQVPVRSNRLEPGDDLIGVGRMLPIQSTPLENTLNAFGHVQPTASQRRVQGHDPMGEQPQDKLGRGMSRQIV